MAVTTPVVAQRQSSRRRTLSMRPALCRSLTLLGVLVCFGSLGACASNPTAAGDGEITDSRIKPCPATPNCVSSDATGGLHGIEPLAIRGDPEASWATLVQTLEADPAYRIIEKTDRFIAAEARTAVLRFVDDVTFELRAEVGEIAMRSASRIGIGDFGANRRRLEKLRRSLEAD